MKRFIVCASLLLFTASTVFAAAFTPKIMKLTVPQQLKYSFDGKNLAIPVTVSGTPATAIFFVYTKGKAASVVKIRNGFLGWHYMNRVDTCMYMSGAQMLDIGSNVMNWDGKARDRSLVPAGDYTYYIWAYDSRSPKELVSTKFGPKFNCAGHIQQYDAKNMVMANPVYYPSPVAVPQLSVANGGYDSKTQNPGMKIRARWIIGTTPQDSTMIETTAFMGWGDDGKIALMPGEHTKFFVQNYIPKAVVPGGLHKVRKYSWVPNGTSQQKMDFGTDGEVTFANTSTGYAGPISDNLSSLWCIVGDNGYPDISNPAMMYYLDPNDGTVLRTYDFKWLWWDPTEVAKGYKYHGGPTQANYSNGRIYNQGLSFCMKHCIDPTQTKDSDVTLWYNGNGDYVGDRFWDPNAGARAWLCSGDSTAPWVYDYSGDPLGFSIFSTYDLGAVSFGLLGPDGTGFGYLAYAGDVAGLKYGPVIVDSNTAFDGIYCDNITQKTYPTSLWYIANDSIQGSISQSISVKEDQVEAFTVSQNTPNPFNPETTISFTVPKTGMVSVDVFNAAGQKVDTITNAFMTAGSHSVTWNASKFSAGIYFYTVKSGNTSKTLKMTLLK
ncbi:MAG: T9SS type A sorting domain-containing protein [Candidatus Latescibacter sp.]|nr:T9SS type A sorting domain-containing protein [Candidatus Latescibacter sp.]